MQRCVKKCYIIFLTFSFFICPLHSQSTTQDTLTYENAKWNTVLNGEVVLPPKTASKGFIAFSDGKLLTYINSNGDVIYQKGVRCVTYEGFWILENDFVAFAADSNTLILINSCGVELWRRKADFVIKGVTQGQDGRLFVKGSEKILCIDLMGRKRWQVDTEVQSDNALCVLNDGSVFCVLKATKQNSSSVMRISPFGQTLEIIEYDGLVIDSQTVAEGVLLSFTSGEFALSTIEIGASGSVLDAKGEAAIAKAKVSWALKERGSKNISTTRFVTLTQKTSALLIDSGGAIKVIVFANQDGDILQSFTISNKSLPSQKLISASLDGSGLFIMDKKEAIVYDFLSTAAKDLGIQMLGRNMPQSSDKIGDYNYAVYLNDEVLVLFSPSWLMAGFKMISKVQDPTTKKKKPQSVNRWKKARSIYSGFYTNLQYTYIDEAVINDDDIAVLERGFYGKKERDYATRIFSASLTYCNTFSVIKSNQRIRENTLIVSQVQSLYTTFVKQLFLLGGIKSTSCLAYLIENEKGTSCLRVIFDLTRLYPYDDDYLLLKAIRARLQSIPYNDTKTLCLLSEAVDTICSFMGTEAAVSYGIEIQSKLLDTQYQDKVKQSARKFLSKY